MTDTSSPPKRKTFFGGAMISSSYQISEFVDAVKTKGYKEVIYLIDKEMLAAWRSFLKNGNTIPANEYIRELKLFIRYLRSSTSMPKHPIFMPSDLLNLYNELKGYNA